ncbi:probable linoleate 9S-lipoxygenase 5 [Zingiber officinale]|uniref:Lipoxygenase n=1 Tax=Zingiber officinale TaxID=94328 RepID=A0A8J5FMJ9_ZINOF|nr:probable linoleate 9S-lipoxygenase 5 [Zingiber officinale]KAG6490528.1 hypothetical protein ZIOFF_051826 [Zingiber officinale]
MFGSAVAAGVMDVEATVVLMKKEVLEREDFNATLVANAQELLSSFQLVSATVGDPNDDNRGVVGEKAYLEDFVRKLQAIASGESTFRVTFKWVGEHGIPGAVIVINEDSSEFYLKSMTLEEFPGEGRIHFDCNSWVYPQDKYKYQRVFFVNKTYVAAETPSPLQPYREDELKNLRGEDVTGPLQEWDRVYDYAYYNDLGDPDKNASLARPVLGGSALYPYPRRGKTGRPASEKDPETESTLPAEMDIYVPRDERFGHLKTDDFRVSAIKALIQAFFPVLQAIHDNEFDSFEDVLKLYKGGLQLQVGNNLRIDELRERIPFEMIREMFCAQGEGWSLKFPLPQVIQEDTYAWRTDEEFTREMLAGVNPVIIRRLEEFPPVSKLDESEYGDHKSTITAAQIERNLEGMTIEEALGRNRLFILDHHDSLMPYLNKINDTANKVYATRTLLFLRDDSTLKPLAIELSLPHPDGEQHGAVSEVYTPADSGVEASIWQLAKAYVTVNDSGVHQLISHWLNTHATMEPFVIATNRHLSVLHPINKLLEPHYRDTMNINATARQVLINAGGIIERTFFPAKYAMEMSAVVYKSWNFVEQGLPADLIKRGIAVRDSKGEIELLIEDYPYAVDGLAIWSAIETWVSDYCSIYYPDDKKVRDDAELQAWWKEVREVGHGDKKHEPWWAKMETVTELTETCTTIIWVASALHAAVNFGQYPYTGYHPNRPTLSRNFMPERGTAEFAELERDPDKVFLQTITNKLQTITGVSVVEILSTHSSDEVYLGQRDTAEWTADQKALEAFERFGAALRGIEAEIVARNGEGRFKNRNGPVKVPYTLLYSTSGVGLTGKGIPNSVSI